MRLIWTSDQQRGFGPFFHLYSTTMIATVYIIAFILAVLFITYPKDFSTAITNPRMLLELAGMETKRRWMILTIGSTLWVEKKRMQYSLWRMKDIIDTERTKQQQKETHID